MKIEKEAFLNKKLDEFIEKFTKDMKCDLDDFMSYHETGMRPSRYIRLWAVFWDWIDEYWKHEASFNENYE